MPNWKGCFCLTINAKSEDVLNKISLELKGLEGGIFKSPSRQGATLFTPYLGTKLGTGRAEIEEKPHVSSFCLMQ